MLDELQSYANRMEAIKSRFGESYLSFEEVLKSRLSDRTANLYLSTEAQADFRQLVLEVNGFFDNIFGLDNPYSQEFNKAIKLGAKGGYHDGPSFSCVSGLAGIIRAALTDLQRRSRSTLDSQLKMDYISPVRIEELSKVNSSRFNLTKLIQLCKELNIAHQQSQLYSMAMLTRAILDHIPPVFSCKNFSDVANQYKGDKSFKDQMQHLDNSIKKVAHAHLHSQIRENESLPTLQQVHCAPALDVLLGEIIRILS